MVSLFCRASGNSSSRVPRIYRLITKKDWEGLSTYLHTKAGIDEANKYGSSYTLAHGDFLLHALCRLHPPASVVKDMVRACRKGSAALLNEHLQAPIHVAAASGASPQVMEFLVRMNPEAVAAKDLDGRTPLHLHCANCCFSGTCDTGHQECELVKGPSIAIILLLCRNADSLTVYMQDTSLMSPMEYCIRYGAGVDAVKALRDASDKAQRRLRSTFVMSSKRVSRSSKFKQAPRL